MNKKLKDEHYIIDLCDNVLNIKASRSHTFDFLRGDPNKNNVRKKLPVDAYYLTLNLVIEYNERQHTEKVTFFDKPNKMTVSGVSRGEQRKIYDQRRKEVLPKHGIDLIVLSYFDFNYDTRKRIIRNSKNDIKILKQKLKKYVNS
tara:strand:+ start:1213 stop:1647 length:435 start_codon:yes stop_codon:yes gene_type:complete